jgi:signal transduction histidine kinase
MNVDATKRGETRLGRALRHLADRVVARASAAWPRTLRSRLIGALLLTVVLAVAAETVSHMAEVSSRLERDLAAHGARVTEAIQSELDQTVTALDFELEAATDPRGPVARALGSGRPEARFLGTRARLQEGVLEILKVLGPDGAIFSSGHWPASFGALDPLLPFYRGEDGRGLHVVDEPTPAGSAPALERWAVGRAGTREIVVVAGHFLGAQALERLRGRTGADVVALCRIGRPTTEPGGPARCLAVHAAGALAPGATFDPDDPDLESHLHLQGIDLGTHALYVGLDRSSIEGVRAAILRRAVAVGLASIAFAMILGTLLATRFTRPVELLAEQAGTLASGDLTARVPTDVAHGDEVERLVTAFNRMAADLEKNQQRLRQAERVAAWQEIARGLAHELKNPLTPILSAMEVIRKARKLERPDFDAILDEQSTAVIEEVMRLKELSDAFARFARLPDRNPEPLRMHEVVDHAAALYVQSEGIDVERVYDETLPPVTADRTQIGTVVTNLVKNAVEAIQNEGDGKGKLRLALRRVDVPAAHGANDGATAPKAWCELRVEDSGPGIAPEMRDRLFTPYATTKGSRGTGLGLALAHRIVVEHGGAIEAERSTLGGAALVVRLPLGGSGAA